MSEMEKQGEDGLLEALQSSVTLEGQQELSCQRRGLGCKTMAPTSLH